MYDNQRAHMAQESGSGPARCRTHARATEPQPTPTTHPRGTTADEVRCVRENLTHAGALKDGEGTVTRVPTSR